MESQAGGAAPEEAPAPVVLLSALPEAQRPLFSANFDPLPPDATEPPPEDIPASSPAATALTLEDRLAAVSDPSKERRRRSLVAREKAKPKVEPKKRVSAPKTPGVKRARGEKNLTPLPLPDNMPADINVTVGECQLVNTGVIVWDRPKFHTVNHIFPVGLKFRCKFACLEHPREKHWYTSEIFDNGEEPLFKVTCDDNPSYSFCTTSASSSWSMVLKELNEKIENRRQTFAIQGTKYFGLTEPEVRSRLEKLPNASKLSLYVPDAQREQEGDDE